MRKRIISVPVRQSIYGQGKAGNAKQKRNKNKKQKKREETVKKKKRLKGETMAEVFHARLYGQVLSISAKVPRPRCGRYHTSCMQVFWR